MILSDTAFRLELMRDLRTAPPDTSLCNAAADEIEDTMSEIERLIEENESLRKSLEIWIFNCQRMLGDKPDVARQYAKAWMFRNAGGKEPE